MLYLGHTVKWSACLHVCVHVYKIQHILNLTLFSANGNYNKHITFIKTHLGFGTILFYKLYSDSKLHYDGNVVAHQMFTQIIYCISLFCLTNLLSYDFINVAFSYRMKVNLSFFLNYYLLEFYFFIVWP